MKYVKILGLMIVPLFLAVGCGRGGDAAATSELEDSFKLNASSGGAVRSDPTTQNAPAQPKDEVQQMVNQAVSAMRTNAYVEAAATLQVLKNQPVLTPEQRIAVQNASVAVLARVAEAADRGDPAAMRAVEAIKAMPRR